VDVISFLTLKIFAAHVTGNLVLIAALIVGGRKPNLDQDLAVPVFILATATVWLIAKILRSRGLPLARLLLLVQFALLTAVLVISLQCRPSTSPKGLMFTVDAMTAISAMACQFALLRIIMPNAPSTAVMTGNLSGSTLALLDMMTNEPLVAGARQRLRKQFTLLLGFLPDALGVLHRFYGAEIGLGRSRRFWQQLRSHRHRTARSTTSLNQPNPAKGDLSSFVENSFAAARISCKYSKTGNH
jgi:uncharacterized membrane protein YoaK (UPF0700 family)